MSDWEFLNAHRITTGPYASKPTDGFTGGFVFRTRRRLVEVKCFASDGLGWQHVSVSHWYGKFTPTWETMCEIKNLFWEPEDWVVQFHPAESAYVNDHPGCLHLWRPLNAIMPIPERIMVGGPISQRDIEDAKQRLAAEKSMS